MAGWRSRYGEGLRKVVLATLFNGQYFGELSLFDGAPRSATATAVEPSRLVRLDRDDLVDFVNKNPAAALRIIEEMGDRLRQTNELMSRQVSRNVLEGAGRDADLRPAHRRPRRGLRRLLAVHHSLRRLMTVWMGINVARVANFDPYPFILLNLALSTVAALQAPIIMMSQNRQSSKDKLLAENDYQVNLKAEMEIAALLRGQAELLARLAVVERAIGGGPSSHVAFEESLRPEPNRTVNARSSRTHSARPERWRLAGWLGCVLAAEWEACAGVVLPATFEGLPVRQRDAAGPAGEDASAPLRRARYDLHVISNAQNASPSVWHFVSTTAGSLPPWRRIDSR